MKKSTLLMLVSLISTSYGFSQFLVKDTYFETYDVSNEGEVVGYTDWGGPYTIWNPDENTIDTINGLAPGNGIGSHAMFSADGNLLSGTMQDVDGPVMARYNRTTDTWMPLGSLGWTVDGTWSGGYSISGNGTTVVGNSWADTTGGHAYMHAIAWHQPEGLIDLGTLYFDRSTRANDISADASVIVGWQDFNGPWKSAVWKKNPAGGYYANQYILLDPEGDSTDENNQMGECTTISSDGNWIGGEGDFANDGHAWIWSEATGVVDLGTLAEGGRGYVAAMNENGTLAVGRIQLGPWDPELAFVWTPGSGMEDLNDYAHTALGLDLGDVLLLSANCMSPNGKYIAGYGVDTVAMKYVAYRISMEVLSVHEIAEQQYNVYPNPAANQVTIDCPVAATVAITNPDGKLVTQVETLGKHKIDISGYAPGVYFISGQSVEGKHLKPSRLIKQ